MESKEKSDFKANTRTVLETCVLCGKLTNIQKDTPIGKRQYYVETAGQLCPECYFKIYVPTHNDNILTP